MGVTTDRTFGPLVVCGLGGTLVEVLHDVAFRLTPVSDLDAAEMLASLRPAACWMAIAAPPVDREALVSVILRISALVESVPELLELDLNPVKVLPVGQGAVVRWPYASWTAVGARGQCEPEEAAHHHTLVRRSGCALYIGRILTVVPTIDAYTPREIARKVEALGVTKARSETLSVLVLAVLAGAFIALGALFFTVVVTRPMLGFGISRPPARAL